MQIKDRIREAGISGADLARSLGVHESAVSLKLAGKRPWKPSELIVVRDMLNEAGAQTTVDQLIEESEAA